jgi:hypothetical protein
MSKYTEDDLKSNSKIKNTNTDFTDWKPKPFYCLNEGYRSCYFSQKENQMDDRLAP